jgi:hypothetical protein
MNLMSIDDGMGYDSDPKRPWRFSQKKKQDHGDTMRKSMEIT